MNRNRWMLIILLLAATALAAWLVLFRGGNEQPPRANLPGAEARDAEPKSGPPKKKRDQPAALPAKTEQPPASAAPVAPAEAAAPTEAPAPVAHEWRAFKISFAGKVVDESGNPVVGADVELGGHKDPDLSKPPVAATESVVTAFAPDDGELPANCRGLHGGAATSGNGGAFAFDWSGEYYADADTIDRLRSPPWVRVWARKAAYMPASTSLLCTWTDPSFPSLKLVLSPGASLRGRVIWKTTREPVAGATVSASVSDRDGWPTVSPILKDGCRVIPPLLTDGRGEFLIRDLPSGTLSICATVPGVTPNEATGRNQFSSAQPTTVVVFAGGDQTVDVELAEASVLRFRLRPAQDKPVAVELLPMAEGISRAGKTVTTYAGGSVVPGVTRSVWDSPTFTPDQTGQYSVYGLTPQHTSVLISAAEFAPTEVQVSPRVREDLDLGTVTLQAAPSMHGRVLKSHGTPVEGAVLQVVFSADSPERFVLLWGSSSAGREVRCTTGADGRYVLAGLVPGTHNLTLSAEGLATFYGKLTAESGAAPVERDFMLYVGGVVSGTVNCPGGLPINPMQPGHRAGWDFPAVYSADVFLVPDSVPTDRARSHIDRYSPWADRLFGQMEITSEGELPRYTITHVPPGTYTAFIRVGDGQDWGEESRIVRGVTVVDGQTTTVNFELTGVSRVSGVVIGFDGKPLEGAWVTADGSTGDSTNADGLYELPRVKPGSAKISVLARAARPYEPDGGSICPPRAITVVAGGETQCNFDLSRDAGIKVRLQVTLDGMRVFDYVGGEQFDSAPKKSRGMIGASISEDGVAEFFVWQPGRLALTVSPSRPSGSVGHFELNVPDQRVWETTVDLKSGWIQGRVIAPLGVQLTSLASATVEAMPDAPNMSFSGGGGAIRCAADGTFKLRVVRGRVVVTARMIGFGAARATVDAGAESQVELTLGQPTATVVFNHGVLSEEAARASDQWQVILTSSADAGLPEYRRDRPSAFAVISNALKVKNVAQGEYVLLFPDYGLVVDSITGPGIREESVPVDEKTAPLGKRWILTVSSGGTVNLSVTLKPKPEK